MQSGQHEPFRAPAGDKPRAFVFRQHLDGVRGKTHFADLGTWTMGSGSELLSGSAEMACRVGRNLKDDATGPANP